MSGDSAIGKALTAEHHRSASSAEREQWEGGSEHHHSKIPENLTYLEATFEEKEEVSRVLSMIKSVITVLVFATKNCC